MNSRPRRPRLLYLSGLTLALCGSPGLFGSLPGLSAVVQAGVPVISPLPDFTAEEFHPELGMDDNEVVIAHSDGVSLVVWTHWDGLIMDIYGARLDSNGDLLDQYAFPIATRGEPEHKPAIAAGRNGRFLVTWIESVSTQLTSTGGLRAARIDASGVSPVLVDGGPLELTDFQGYEPAVVAAPFVQGAADRFLIAWTQTEGLGEFWHRLAGLELDWGQDPPGEPELLTIPPVEPGPCTGYPSDLALAWVGDRYAMVFKSGEDQSAVCGALVSSGPVGLEGTLPALVLDTPGLIFDPAIACDGPQCLVGWKEDRTECIGGEWQKPAADWVCNGVLDNFPYYTVVASLVNVNVQAPPGGNPFAAINGARGGEVLHAEQHRQSPPDIELLGADYAVTWLDRTQDALQTRGRLLTAAEMQAAAAGAPLARASDVLENPGASLMDDRTSVLDSAVTDNGDLALARVWNSPDFRTAIHHNIIALNAGHLEADGAPELASRRFNDFESAAIATDAEGNVLLVWRSHRNAADPSGGGEPLDRDLYAVAGKIDNHLLPDGTVTRTFMPYPATFVGLAVENRSDVGEPVVVSDGLQFIVVWTEIDLFGTTEVRSKTLSVSLGGQNGPTLWLGQDLWIGPFAGGPAVDVGVRPAVAVMHDQIADADDLEGDVLVVWQNVGGDSATLTGNWLINHNGFLVPWGLPARLPQNGDLPGRPFARGPALASIDGHMLLAFVAMDQPAQGMEQSEQLAVASIPHPFHDAWHFAITGLNGFTNAWRMDAPAIAAVPEGVMVAWEEAVGELVCLEQDPETHIPIGPCGQEPLPPAAMLWVAAGDIYAQRVTVSQGGHWENNQWVDELFLDRRELSFPLSGAPGRQRDVALASNGFDMLAVYTNEGGSVPGEDPLETAAVRWADNTPHVVARGVVGACQGDREPRRVSVTSLPNPFGQAQDYTTDFAAICDRNDPLPPIAELTAWRIGWVPGSTCPEGVLDGDGDMHCDDVDNCPGDFNVAQADEDGDGVGNACDVCPAVADPQQLDTDGDWIGDLCDLCPNVADNGADADGNGVGDACETSCSLVHATPGCDDAQCEQTVCAQDPWCCQVNWDNTCVNEAQAWCGAAGGGAQLACAVAKPPGQTGCQESAACEACVCQGVGAAGEWPGDGYCCGNSWDGLCANEVAVHCSAACTL